MQDLRQDLRPHQDYGGGGDGGGWRGGRGAGGRGPPIGGRGRGDGADFRGRGSSYSRDDDRYLRIQQRRKESRASICRRIINSLDISPTMAAPAVLAAKDDVLSAPQHSSSAILHPNFDRQPFEPQTFMHNAFHTREPPLPSIIKSSSSSTSIDEGQQQQSLDAGDLSVALESAMNRGSKEKDRLIKSKIGGHFLASKSQDELVRKSISSTAKK